MLFLFCAGLWTLALLGGFGALLVYETTPGGATPSPTSWPADSAQSRTPGRFILIMAAHPRCPCTRASIAELALVLERSSAPVDTRVLFLKPADSDWAPTELWRQAAAIRGVEVSWDEGGVEAARFGIRTSGHTVLFDQDGKLIFSGGVTNARGHAGPSKGNVSLANWLTPDESGEAEAPVFGCSLTNPISACSEGRKACQNP